MLGKDKSKIKLFGGEHLFLKPNISGGAWFDCGELLNDVKIPDVTSLVEIIGNAGNAFDLLGVRKVNFTAKLAQTGKSEWDLIVDDSRGITYKLYYYNGVVGGEYDEFYAPEVMIVSDLTHDTSGKPMSYDLKCSVRPGSAVVTGTPSDLPTVKKASANFTGKNVYYARIVTTVV